MGSGATRLLSVMLCNGVSIGKYKAYWHMNFLVCSLIYGCDTHCLLSFIFEVTLVISAISPKNLTNMYKENL